MEKRKKRVSSAHRSLRNQLWNRLERAYELSTSPKPDFVSVYGDLRAAIQLVGELRGLKTRSHGLD